MSQIRNLPVHLRQKTIFRRVIRADPTIVTISTRPRLGQGYKIAVKKQKTKKKYQYDQVIINCQSCSAHAWSRTFKKSHGVMQDSCFVLTHG